MQPLKSTDDLYLVERGAQGDRDAIDQLIRKHQECAQKYANRLTSDRDLADDIVSEAFVRVYRSIHGFKGQSAFTTWLYRIITNCFLDSRKRQACRPTSSLDEALEVPNGEVQRQFISDDDDPVEIIARRAQAATLSEATEMLPAQYRQIVLLYHGDMLSYEEIAAALDIPIGTVKSRLNRARAALGQMLRNREAELTAT